MMYNFNGTSEGKDNLVFHNLKMDQKQYININTSCRLNLKEYEQKTDNIRSPVIKISGRDS